MKKVWIITAITLLIVGSIIFAGAKKSLAESQVIQPGILF